MEQATFAQMKGWTMDTQIAQFNAQRVNVGDLERKLSLVGGIFTLAYLLARRPNIKVSLPLLLESAYMLYRGTTGHCMVYQAMDIDRSNGHGSWQTDDRARHDSER